MKFFYDIAHQFYIMASSRPVVADRTRHPVVDRFVNDRYWEHSLFPFIDIRIIQHDTVTVKSVYNNISIIFYRMITYDRHGISVFPNTFIKKLHLRRGDGIGVVCIWFDFFDRYSDDVVYRTFLIHESRSSSPLYFDLMISIRFCCCLVRPNPIKRHIWSFFRIQKHIRFQLGMSLVDLMSSVSSGILSRKMIRDFLSRV